MALKTDIMAMSNRSCLHHRSIFNDLENMCSIVCRCIFRPEVLAHFDGGLTPYRKLGVNDAFHKLLMANYYRDFF